MERGYDIKIRKITVTPDGVEVDLGGYVREIFIENVGNYDVEMYSHKLGDRKTIRAGTNITIDEIRKGLLRKIRFRSVAQTEIDLIFKLYPPEEVPKTPTEVQHEVIF